MESRNIEKHNYIGKECRAISFDIAHHRFMCIKESDTAWRLRSYESMNLPDIMIEMPKDNMSLNMVADTAMYALYSYINERQDLLQTLVLGIKEHVKDGSING